MIRVRNNHPITPLQCSGRILPPGVWVEVDEKFREGFDTVPHLEFEEVVPVPRRPDASPVFDAPAEPEAVAVESPHALGVAAGLRGDDVASCPYPDGRTKDAKEWRRGHREAST